MNEAPGLPLTVGLMGELVENKELGHKVVAEGFKGPALDPSTKGRMPCNRVPSFAAGSMGGGDVAVEGCRVTGYHGGCGG